jgi:hypothetical protein
LDTIQYGIPQQTVAARGTVFRLAGGRRVLEQRPVAVAIVCPACEHVGAVAMVRLDDSTGRPGLLRIESLNCRHGCTVDTDDPELLAQLGLTE